MSQDDAPRLYLMTPKQFTLDAFAPQLAGVLDQFEIACLRMTLVSQDELQLSKCADALREICYPRDVPLVISDHLFLVEKLGLDGVHFDDGARRIAKARKALNDEYIIGSYCTASRHEGINAGEQGADYISFGPVTPSNLGTAETADIALFEWWSEMIEVPIVAEGGLTAARVAQLAQSTDFFAIGDEIWQSEDPRGALAALIAPLG